tara:strand:+ start:1258 stop:1479 length:222 start_codon:yes stop_codon:yes gene_type:complete
MNRIFEGGHSGRGSHSTPEQLVEIFTFDKYTRKAKENQDFVNTQLMEQMINDNTSDRFNEQKASQGEKTHLDV